MFLSYNGFLSCNIDFKMVLITFSSLSSWKRGDLLFYQWSVIFLSFYRVILGFFYGKQQILLNWIYLRVFWLNFVGFWGVGKGFLYWFRIICLGFLFKGFMSKLKSDDVGLCNC